jgi:hypothetical protein
MGFNEKIRGVGSAALHNNEKRGYLVQLPLFSGSTDSLAFSRRGTSNQHMFGVSQGCAPNFLILGLLHFNFFSKLKNADPP